MVYCATAYPVSPESEFLTFLTFIILVKPFLTTLFAAGVLRPSRHDRGGAIRAYTPTGEVRAGEILPSDSTEATIRQARRVGQSPASLIPRQHPCYRENT